MRHPEYLFPMLKIAFGFRTMEAYAKQQLGLKSGAYIAQVMNSVEPRKPVSRKMQRKILVHLNEKFPLSSFREIDFDLDPAGFLARFPRNEIDYLAMSDAGRISREILSSTNIHTFLGNYVRIYVCSNLDKPGENMLAVDNFTFAPSSNPDEAIVTQLTNEFSGGLPRGKAKYYGPTLVIDIVFPGQQYPPAIFLASSPKPHAFSVGSLDVKFNSSTVVARPMIFIRVDKFKACPLTFDKGVGLYGPGAELIKNKTILHSKRHELMPRSEILMDELADWHIEYKKIR